LIALPCYLALAFGQAAAPDAPPPEAAPPANRWAIVVVGLPGDEEHESLFRAAGQAYVRWLTESLDFDPSRVVLVGHHPAEPEAKLGATKEQITAAVAELSPQIQPEDALWIVTLGHANYDGERGWLHLAGPDINDLELAELFAEVECREQVFWLTHTCSGWFLPSLSRPGRIVIAATEADQEVNETEFPQALLEAASRPTPELDRDADGRVSLAELFLAVSERVAATFKADNRVPTEHAQLDDDGNGRGSEADHLLLAPPPGDVDQRDGLQAAAMLLPVRTETQ